MALQDRNYSHFTSAHQLDINISTQYSLKQQKLVLVNETNPKEPDSGQMKIRSK
jgi:hypothetical protein